MQAVITWLCLITGIRIIALISVANKLQWSQRWRQGFSAMCVRKQWLFCGSVWFIRRECFFRASVGVHVCVSCERGCSSTASNSNKRPWSRSCCTFNPGAKLEFFYRLINAAGLIIIYYETQQTWKQKTWSTALFLFEKDKVHTAITA